jgi:hypothetical protein
MKGTDAGVHAPHTVLFWRRADAFVAQHGRVVGVRWTGIPSKQQLAALAQAHRCAREHGEVLLINDVLRVEGATHVDLAIRAELLELIRTCHAKTRAVAHVIEVPGLVGNVVRGFLEMLERIGGRTSTSVAAFDGLDAAARWLHRIGGGRPGVEDLRSIWRSMERVNAVPMVA